MNLICSVCGGAITHSCPAQSDATHDAIPGATAEAGTFAHGSEDLKNSPKKRGVYNQGYDEQFLEFWNLYPLHRDKRKAQRAWRNAIRRASTAQINEGAIRYRDDPNRRPQFTKYAEGWLNGDGWEDEALPRRAEEDGLSFRDRLMRRADG